MLNLRALADRVSCLNAMNEARSKVEVVDFIEPTTAPQKLPTDENTAEEGDADNKKQFWADACKAMQHVWRWTPLLCCDPCLVGLTLGHSSHCVCVAISILHRH